MEAHLINYIPRGDRVILKRLPPPEPKEGEVRLPDSQKRPMNAGTVVAVGPGARNVVTGQIDAITDLKPGDIVEFLDYAGAEVEIDGEAYLSVRESEIHGKRPSC